MGKKPAAKIATLDLHGRKTDEVFDLVEAFLSRENQKGATRARIMPGKGEGKLKAVVIDYLKKAHYPWQFEGGNEGVLVVFLD